MNKVSNKSKGCANKKCPPQQNGAQLKDSGPPETNSLKKNIEDLKVKRKPINGLVNGTTDDKQIISNKTETHASQVKIDDSSRISLVTNEVTNDHAEKCEMKSNKKSKSKKRNKIEQQTEQTKRVGVEESSSEIDLLSLLRSKLVETSRRDDELKDVACSLEGLDLNKDKGEKSTEEEPPRVENPNIEYVAYQSEMQMPLIMKIIQKDLSEPYSIYTYRYFIHNWPNLCFLAMCDETCVGAIVCKLDMHRKVIKRGYIAMLAVDKRYRKYGIGSTLVRRAIQEMITGNADEVVLETEITNKPALRLYEALGFVRDKRLFRYYLNGVDALRLKLWLR